MTWSGSTGGWGHINTFNTPGFETRSNKSMDLKSYYNTLQTQPQSISQLNHPPLEILQTLVIIAKLLIKL